MQQCYKKMKDISTSDTGRRKRKQSDDSWLKKYKQLDVSILKNATKIEKNEDNDNVFTNRKQYGFKKRKPDINLVGAFFPDDLNASFCHGEISELSFSVTNDHVVPGNEDDLASVSSAVIGFEDPLGEEEIYYESPDPNPIGKFNPTMKGKHVAERKILTNSSPCIARNILLRTPKPPSVHFKNTQSSWNENANIKGSNAFHIQQHRQRNGIFVPVTPSVPRTPFIGNIHRQNSGFAVPETPAFLLNGSRITSVKETPLIG